MEQHEKDVLEEIRRQAEKIDIPQSLRPEVVEQELRTKKYRTRRNAYRAILAAACCLTLVCAAAVYRTDMWGTVKFSFRKPNPVAYEARRESNIKMAGAYEDIFAYLSYPAQDIYMEKDEASAVEYTGGVMNINSQNKGSSDVSRGESGYYETNTRQEGVGEADVVKTDGRYLYVVKDEGTTIGIVDTQNTRMEEVGVIEIEDSQYISEIYIQGEKLIALYAEANVDRQREVYHSNHNMKTAVYDVSDIENPKRIGDITQSGYYYTSRLNGDYLYVFSQYYVDNSCGKDDYGGYVPFVEEEIFPLNKIYLPDTDSASMYTVITSVNLNEPDKTADTAAILSNGSTCYVSTENIYMCDNTYEGNEAKTSIRKISYKDGIMAGEAKTEVAGYLNDSFSIDEYNGSLRMVTTIGDSETNSLYVLDENLEMSGSIEGLAKDERVYSARFMGDVGYFVTFRETDPLFSVDLSNPTEPKIIGELKIPGFSEYLHPYGDGLLLGIGMEVDEKGVTENEVKLSMFDISNPADVKEIHKCVIENAYGSTAFDNYKSVTIDEGKNMIGFSAFAEHEKYYLYEYDKEKGFICNMEKSIPNSYAEARGIYIGDVFYIVKGGQIESFSLENYEKIDDIIL